MKKISGGSINLVTGILESTQHGKIQTSLFHYKEAYLLQ